MKLPTTVKLPKIPFLTKNDSWSHLLGVPLVFTVRMDGVQTSFSANGLFVKDRQDHPSVDLLKTKYRQMVSLLSNRMQFFGEWLQSSRFIAYENELALNDYLYIFGIYENGKFWSMREMRTMCLAYGMCPVPIVYEDTFWNEWSLIEKANELLEAIKKQGHAGLVIRRADSFSFVNFVDHMAKVGSTVKVPWATYPWKRNQLGKNKDEYFFN